jgi:hypothetical protein
MKTTTALIYAQSIVLFSQCAFGQGTFQNLDFEQANPIPLGVPYIVATTNGLPGWTTYLGNSQSSEILYDTISLGGAAISLHDSASHSFQPIQGNYSVFLQGSGAGPATSSAIGQNGQVPTDAVSVRFWADPRSNLKVTFGGQEIFIYRLANMPGYDIFGGDISSFAGQTAELLFTGPGNSGGYFDNIFFSNQPIPEPSAFCLFGLGALLLGWQFTRKQP